jgi:uncharacterized protein (DUF1697 family)
MKATCYVALLRGINVGRAKRVAMADLRALLDRLGYADVRTLLNSGNVVFRAAGVTADKAAARIEGAIATELGVSSRVTVLTAADLAGIVADKPDFKKASDPSRLLVAVPSKAADRARLAPLQKQSWTPELLAVGSRAAYLWCPEGIVDSPLATAVGRVLGDGVTSRNWATLTKLHALTQDPE